MQTVVVNIKKEHFDVYIGRAGRGEDGYFGNPFRMGQDSEFKHRVLALKGKRLGCFCKPKACHGDVIADWLNKMEENEVD